MNQAKKIIKEVKKVSHNTKIAFSSIVTCKDRQNIDKKVLEVNSHLKNYCRQKNIDFIDNNNIKEEHLGVKKLHLNKRGNSVLASNILKYLRSTFRNGHNDSNCLRIKSVEHISELSESNAGDVVVFKSLKDVRIKNLNRIVLPHLNINSLRNKFDLLTDQIKGNVDVLVISENKLDDSFPTGQFKIPGDASPFRLDRDENGDGSMVFVREDIPVKFLSSENKPIEAFFFELNFHKKKWLVCCSYNPIKITSPVI